MWGDAPSLPAPERASHVESCGVTSIFSPWAGNSVPMPAVSERDVQAGIKLISASSAGSPIERRCRLEASPQSYCLSAPPESRARPVPGLVKVPSIPADWRAQRRGRPSSNHYLPPSSRKARIAGRKTLRHILRLSAWYGRVPVPSFLASYRACQWSPSRATWTGGAVRSAIFAHCSHTF